MEFDCGGLINEFTTEDIMETCLKQELNINMHTNIYIYTYIKSKNFLINKNYSI